MPKRVAFSRDLGGITPVDPEVAAIVERAARRFEELGCIVEEASPDFADLQMIFQTLRAMGMAASRKGLLASHSDQLKRSDEHTSELQSLMRISYAVFCLTKKKIYPIIIHHINQSSKKH